MERKEAFQTQNMLSYQLEHFFFLFQEGMKK